jgi:ribosomal protein S27E
MTAPCLNCNAVMLAGCKMVTVGNGFICMACAEVIARLVVQQAIPAGPPVETPPVAGNIISLDDYLPHSTGRARCLDCKHEWIAVSRTGYRWLECPSCSLYRGRFIGQHERDEPHLHCHECNNELFYVLAEGVYCPNCGEWQVARK